MVPCLSIFFYLDSQSELMDRIGIEAVGCVLKRDKLRWFDEKTEKKDWVRKGMYLEVEGARTSETWLEVVKNDIT